MNRTVHVDQQETHALADEWRACQIPVDLQIINSPYREAITPLLDYIRDIHISESAIRAEEERLANRRMRWSGNSWNGAQARKLGSPSPTSVS